MLIHGFQKLTMLDFPDRVACTVFTGGCNFRCPFCHNARLVTHLETEDIVNETEVFEYLDKRRKLLDGVCITGGEPLLQHDIKRFAERIKSMGLDVKLDTNGSFPKKLQELVSLGLVDYVAMDIKNSPEQYGVTVGIPDFDISCINETVKYLLKDHVDYEFRTTVVKELHSIESLTDIAKWIKGAKRYYLQAFADSGDIIGENLSAHDNAFMIKARETLQSIIPVVSIRG